MSTVNSIHHKSEPFLLYHQKHDDSHFYVVLFSFLKHSVDCTFSTEIYDPFHNCIFIYFSVLETSLTANFITQDNAMHKLINTKKLIELTKVHWQKRGPQCSSRGGVSYRQKPVLFSAFQPFCWGEKSI